MIEFKSGVYSKELVKDGFQITPATLGVNPQMLSLMALHDRIVIYQIRVAKEPARHLRVLFFFVWDGHLFTCNGVGRPTSDHDEGRRVLTELVDQVLEQEKQAEHDQSRAGTAEHAQGQEKPARQNPGNFFRFCAFSREDPVEFGDDVSNVTLKPIVLWEDYAGPVYAPVMPGEVFSVMHASDSTVTIKTEAGIRFSFPCKEGLASVRWFLDLVDRKEFEMMVRTSKRVVVAVKGSWVHTNPLDLEEKVYLEGGERFVVINHLSDDHCDDPGLFLSRRGDPGFFGYRTESLLRVTVIGQFEFMER